MNELPTTDRRQFLTLAAAAGASVLLSAAAGTAWAPAAEAAARTRVYVLVVDGCRPEEITPALTPNLAALRASGTNYPAARSLPIMETIPNHVMMMTGVRPDRSGVPANSFYDRNSRTVRDMDQPSDLRFATLLDRLQTKGYRTGSVLSKQYLFGIFGTRATYRWEPRPVLPVTGHAPDQFTMDALLSMVDGPDPDFVFTNLGDIDRIGHSDVTGTTARAARLAALASTDLQVGRFIGRLKSSGKWTSSIVMVLADHSMDWSIPTNVISVKRILSARPDLSNSVQIAQNGGADLIYWTGAASGRAAGLSAIAGLVRAHPGVLSTASPSTLRLGAQGGDLVVYCKAGWRFSDPYVVSNPIPGNHGHPATEPIPFFISGGSPKVRTGQTRGDSAHTIDVAPTVGAIFRLGSPSGGYDGTARTTGLIL